MVLFRWTVVIPGALLSSECFLSPPREHTLLKQDAFSSPPPSLFVSLVVGYLLPELIFNVLVISGFFIFLGIIFSALHPTFVTAQQPFAPNMINQG